MPAHGMRGDQSLVVTRPTRDSEQAAAHATFSPAMRGPSQQTFNVPVVALTTVSVLGLSLSRIAPRSTVEPILEQALQDVDDDNLSEHHRLRVWRLCQVILDRAYQS